MWKRRSASSARLTLAGGRRFPVPTGRLAFFLLALCLVIPVAQVRAEQLITRITVNQEEKGDFFVNRTESGDFQVKGEDLRAMGFRAPAGSVVLIDGTPHLSLRSMTGVSYSFDENTLSLAITANPSLLGSRVIDFTAQQTEKVYQPRDTSAFFDYGLDYFGGNGASSGSFKFSQELGARKGDLLFLSDSLFSESAGSGRFTRLQSSVTWDDRARLWRVVGGDFFASSGELGSSLNLGGISFSKVYRIDPYFINYPTMGVTGQVALPTEATVYLNGMQVRTEKFSPGEFSLQNITGYGGAGGLEVVLKDALGREQRLSYPFYFANSFLLKKGLQEFSYNLGFVRERYGTGSNDYGKAAFSAFHHWGISDQLTVGFRAEADSSLLNLGPQANFLIDKAGVVSLSAAGSAGKGAASGGALSAAYQYQGTHAGAHLALSAFSSDYTTLTAGSATTRPKLQGAAGASYTDRALGSLSLDLATTRQYLGQDTDSVSLGYTRNLTNRLTLNATYRLVKQDGYDNQFLVSFNFTPRPNLFVSASEQAGKDGDASSIELQQNPPVGEGLGYRAIVSRAHSGGEESCGVNPSLQYNGRYGSYIADYNGQQRGGEFSDQYHLSATGALVWVGQSLGATRPVYDSFGLVKVGDLKGVKVLLNSQEIGTTDGQGRVFIPNLGSYYNNQVSISDKEIPIDYYLSSISRQVSPPLRSGSCIPFAVVKLQPISGRLLVREDAELKPVEFQEITMTVQGRELVFPTGKGGEFDIDASQSEEFKKAAGSGDEGCDAATGGSAGFIKAGSYAALVSYQGKPIRFTITIPAASAELVQLGDIVLAPAPAAEPAPAGQPSPAAH